MASERCGSRDWYEHITLNSKYQKTVQKITHERRRIGRVRQQVRRIPIPSPDDVVSKLPFGFWPHILDVATDVTHQPVDWPTILVNVVPGHRYTSAAFWGKQRNRDVLFARIDFCKELRNRIAHLEPIWKAGPLMTEGRPRAGVSIIVEHAAPTTPVEALSRLQLGYERVLELLRWLSPDLSKVYLAGEAHHCFSALNLLATIESYKRHGGHRRPAPINLNLHRSLRGLKKELRGIGRSHGTAEVRHNGKPIAWWRPID